MSYARRGSGAFLVAATFAGALVSWDSSAHAEPSRVRVRGTSDCTGDSLRSHAAGESGATLDVVIAKTPSGYLGTLSTREEQGTSSTREVPAASCDEVLRALSFLMDVAAGLEPLAPPYLPRPPKPPPKRHVSIWDVEAGLSTHAALGAFPSPATSVLVALFPDGREGLAVRAGATGAVGHASSADASASTDLLVARVDACAPYLFQLPIGLRSCLGAELGALFVRGHGAGIVGESALVPSLSARASAELSVPLGPQVRGAIEGAARVALLRHRLYVAPDSTVYVPPLVGGEIGAFVSVELP